MRIKKENIYEISWITWFIQGDLFEPKCYLNKVDDSHKLYDAYWENGCRISYSFK